MGLLDQMPDLATVGLLRWLEERTPPVGDNVIGITEEGRLIYENRDGSKSTERTTTVVDQRLNSGRPTNIPTMYGGVEYSPDQAIDVALTHGRIPGSRPEAGMVVDPETGRRLEAYGTLDQAVSAAEARSPLIELLYFGPRKERTR